MRAVHPLRTLSQEEAQALQRMVKASSERVDVVKRAKAILAVQAGQPYTQAAQEAGYKSGDSVSGLVERFNQRGLAALLIAPGRGRKETYTPQQRERIMQEFGRAPQYGSNTSNQVTSAMKSLKSIPASRGGAFR